MTHWRVGLDWFADCLTDWDPASNAMGWQWAAGSGPDAAPYFRIFNPATQAEKFDPERRLSPPLHRRAVAPARGPRRWPTSMRCRGPGRWTRERPIRSRPFRLPRGARVPLRHIRQETLEPSGRICQHDRKKDPRGGHDRTDDDAGPDRPATLLCVLRSRWRAGWSTGGWTSCCPTGAGSASRERSRARWRNCVIHNPDTFRAPDPRGRSGLLRCLSGRLVVHARPAGLHGPDPRGQRRGL